ncbi:MAG: ABC transporter ATP-binding protein [Synergistaceae bacterium]|jgi:simple sugar transport system ATP-binding protein|nr:ABC transporter ATP-binding protein [Synergistaceae bacterium]
MNGIDKIFFGAYANKGVNFDLAAGEIHALLGENGAGKTTLMNVLSGIYAPDGGTVRVEGREVRFRSPRDAIDRGIGMVHQHFMLIPVLSVWENIILSMRGLPFVTDKRGTAEKIMELSERYSLLVDPEAMVWTLSIGERQRVEILKMLYRGMKVLILDEPTSVLTPREVRVFFAALRKMTEAGHGIVIISHKIEEILSIAGRMTILRKGERVATVDAEGATRETLARMMVGRELKNAEKMGTPRSREAVLSCRGLSVRNDRGARALDDVSFDLREGEILGLAGVAGNAQDELCEALAGLRPIDAGGIILQGKDITGLGPREFIDRGMSYIPADRKGTGLVSTMSVMENAALKSYWKKPAAERKFLINWKYVADMTRRLIAAFDVQTPSPDAPVRNLSGGNMQKLMLARELSGKPSVILAMHPVWGLDVGATEFVRERLLEERARGAGILMISEDLDEMLLLADRIMVISRGRIMGIVEEPKSVSKERIGLMMAGTPMDGIDRAEAAV